LPRPFARLGDLPDERNEVREALADAGPRLDGQMPPFGEGLLDRRGHRGLLRPHLVPGQGTGDGTVPTQYPSGIYR